MNLLNAGNPRPGQKPTAEFSKRPAPAPNDQVGGETGVEKLHKFSEQHSPLVSIPSVTAILPGGIVNVVNWHINNRSKCIILKYSTGAEKKN